MAVFPDRIVLKNSTDAQAAIESAIGSGGTDAIVYGEVVIGRESGGAKLYTLDSTGAVVVIGGGAAALGDLTDVDLSTTPPVNGNALLYNGVEWVPGTASTVGSLDDLTDVDLTTTAPVTGDYLKYNGSQWVVTATGAYDVAMDGGDFDTGLTDDTTTIFDQFPISIDAHSDVDTSTTPPTSGQALVWNGVDNWVPGTVAASVALNDLTDVTITAAATGEVLRYNGSAWVDAQLAYSDLSGTPTIPASIDDLTDVDTTTAAPTVDQVLVWDGTNWVPGNQTGGGSAPTFVESDGDLSQFPLAGADSFYANQAAMEADGFTFIAGSQDADDLAIDFDPGANWDGIDFLGNGVLSGGDWFINTNGGVGWDLASNSITSRSGNALTDAASIDFYVSWWSQDTESRLSGWKEHVENGRTYLVVRSDQKVPYSSETNGFPVEAWFGEDGSVSVRYGTAVGGASFTTGVNRNVIVSNGIALGANPYPNLTGSGAYAYHYAAPYDTLGNLDDVNTTGVADGQVLTYVAANNQWEPTTPAPGGVTSIIAGNNVTIDQSTGDVTISAAGGGGGVTGTITRVSETQLAASSAATFSDIGASGLLVSFTSDIDAWIVLYPTAADRTADAGRAYGTDPTPGSGVLAEVFVAAGTTVLASPGTGYFNNDTISSNAVYAAVRDQAGAAANATVTIVAYAHQTFAGTGTNRVTDSGTAASGTLDLVGLGQTGQLCTVTSSLDAWVVFYGSAADRTADAGRGFSTDPSAGSGVMAEFYIAAGTTVLATPGTSYFNNDTYPTDAVYLAVRNQAGAAVDSLVTVTAYAETSYSGISGGTFGSG